MYVCVCVYVYVYDYPMYCAISDLASWFFFFFTLNVEGNSANPCMCAENLFWFDRVSFIWELSFVTGHDMIRQTVIANFELLWFLLLLVFVWSDLWSV